MTLERFFAKFDQFADAPDAVAKLREVVLDLAATGRLLPRKGEWETRSLRSLATKIGSGATPAGGRESYFSKGIPLIRSMNVHFSGFDRTGLVFLSEEQADELSNVVVQSDDVLLNITGASIGRVTSAPTELAGARVNQHVTIIRPTSELFPRFLSMFLASPSVQRMIDEVQVGATRQALTKGMIEQFEIPLPPLAEQKRIVAKVDKLMALCDRLEAQQQEREARHAALARAALVRFAEAPTPANLQLLFHPSYAISPADLRKSILTLAVQGKLVPKNPNEGETRTVSMEELVGRKNLKNGLSLSPTEGAADFVCLPLSAMKGSTIDCSFGKPIAITADRAASYLVKPRDIFIIRGNGSKDRVGIAGMVRSSPSNVLFPDLFIRVPLPAGRIEADYFLIAWNSAVTREMLESLATTTSGIWKVNQGHISECEIPIPPLAEQRRIVAKVDQLMALVDELETQLAASRATAANLLSAVVAELTSSRQSV